MSCCGSKKKPIDPAPSGVQGKTQTTVPGGDQKSATYVASSVGNSQMVASKIAYENKLIKSNVEVKTIPDP